MKQTYETPKIRIVELKVKDFLSGSSEGDNCIDDPYDDPWARSFLNESFSL